VRTALGAVLAEPVMARAALQYGASLGYGPLRERLLDGLLAADGQSRAEAHASLDCLLLSAGSNELLHLITDTICDPGDLVLCTAPTYFVYLGILQNLGAQPVAVASDEQGLIPDALDETLARLHAAGELARVKAVYVVGYSDNPRGVTLARERRPQVVETVKRWSRRAGHAIYVLEDMAYRELCYCGDNPPSLRAFDDDGETVVVAHTFSKSFSPGIRVGYGLLPAALADAVSRQKGSINFGSPSFNQHLMARVLELDLWRPQVERLREVYREKLAAMLAAADQYLAPLPGVRWVRPSGGLYVWVELPEGIDAGPAGRLFGLALERGVLYVPGEYCFPHAAHSPEQGSATAGSRPTNGMRLSFGVQPCQRIEQGMAALAQAIQAAME
jgi:2-aminoadipate transaminase